VAVHPTKACLALQVAATELRLLFLKSKNVEELRFQFPKAMQIHLSSFCFGEDFNFVVVTNNLITLYDVKLSKQKAKVVKQIPIHAEVIAGVFFEPMATTLAVVDNKGQVSLFYLSLHMSAKQSRVMK
jgi:hypothetical protein